MLLALKLLPLGILDIAYISNKTEDNRELDRVPKLIALSLTCLKAFPGLLLPK